MFWNVWRHTAQHVCLRYADRHILGQITNHFAVFLSPYEGARSQRLGIDSAALEKGRPSCACSVNSASQDGPVETLCSRVFTTPPPIEPGRQSTRRTAQMWGIEKDWNQRRFFHFDPRLRTILSPLIIKKVGIIKIHFSPACWKVSAAHLYCEHVGELPLFICAATKTIQCQAIKGK